MKKSFSLFLDAFFGKELDLRIRLFHVIAISGTVISLVRFMIAVFTGMNANIVINILTGLVCIGVLVYSFKSGKYQICYNIVIICVFLILFPNMFLYGGGYKGGMPFFFVFAIVYTVYMLDGWKMAGVMMLEITLYSGLCIYAYLFPEKINTFDSGVLALFDLVMSFFTVSVSLGATLFVQFYLYKMQKKELEKARENAVRANEAKSVFLANMSHEIRTPIHIILGMNEIIRRESGKYQVQQCSEKIDEASKMLLSLVDNILDVSKIESGKMEILPTQYHTKELIDTLLLIGKTRCDKKGLSFRMSIQDDLPDKLTGDIALIKQIISNLLSNAVKYTKTGGVKVKIGYHPGEKEKEIILVIDVMDTGIGIRPEAFPKLFEAFKREDLASHRYIEGTGLGLSIVMTLTELMGGKIKVQSEYGEGSCFSIELPQQIAENESLEENPKIEKFEAPKGKILVVDDNESNRMVMKTLMSETKIQVDTAESGIQCIDMVKKNHYHLILLDYMMIGMNGVDTFKELKKIQGFDTPVAILTANAVSGMEEKMSQLGFVAFITKPVPWSRLESLIRNVLPQEIITIRTVEERQTEQEKYEKLSHRLSKYGITLENALEYFEGDIIQCAKTAKMFMKYNQSEYERAKRLLQQEDYDSLKFLVHSLKGTAKNMGLERLNKTASRLEILCIDEEVREVKSLMPYLFYLWERAGEGLNLLIREMNVQDEERNTDTEEIKDVEECIRILPELFEQLRRKPSLNCLRVILENEAKEEGRDLLKKVETAVRTISFEEAEELFQDYIRWKRSEDNGL